MGFITWAVGYRNLHNMTLSSEEVTSIDVKKTLTPNIKNP